jgi:hypothetical protein
VARLLNEAKLATLLIDLLTPGEEAIDARTAHLRFDIDLLAERLVDATDWLARYPETQHLPIGYFGASTGAAAALVAAAERPDVVNAVVSRGGRPGLAGPALMRVRAPTLLIVGGNDVLVIPGSARAAALRKATCDRAGRNTSLRRIWSVRRSGPVPPPSYPGGATRHCGQQITGRNVVLRDRSVAHLILHKIMYPMIACSERHSGTYPTIFGSLSVIHRITN